MTSKKLAVEKLELSILAMLAQPFTRMSYTALLRLLHDIWSLFSNNFFKWVQKFLAIERLELSTLALLARCSNRLSYTAFYFSKAFNNFVGGFDSCLKFRILN